MRRGLFRGDENVGILEMDMEIGAKGGFCVYR